MHVPDGFLEPPAIAIGAVVATAGVGYALRRVKAEMPERELPLAGLAGAFFLVGDAPFFPVVVGTQGHVMGGMLAVALLGPWLGALTIVVVTVIQALVQGDGGVAALGLNVTNLALVPAYVGYPVMLGLRRLLPRTRGGVSLAVAGGAAVSVLLASGLFVTEYALGATRSIDVGTLAGGMFAVYGLVAILEAVVSAAIIRALLQRRPDLVRCAWPELRRRERRPRAARRPATTDGGRPIASPRDARD